MTITRGLAGLALGTAALLAVVEPVQARQAAEPNTPAQTAEPTAPTQTAAPAPRARASRWDWTADRRRFVEGDIIPVLIDEYTLASANKNSTAKRDRSRDLSLGGGYSVTGPAAANGNVNGAFRSRSAGESTERGQTTRQDRLTSEITVRVVGIEPNGVLRVEGTKRMVIDEHEQEIRLSGLIRPEDVPANNVVESWRIADAVISYDSNGKLGNPKGSVLGRILGWIWP